MLLLYCHLVFLTSNQVNTLLNQMRYQDALIICLVLVRLSLYVGSHQNRITEKQKAPAFAGALRRVLFIANRDDLRLLFFRQLTSQMDGEDAVNEGNFTYLHIVSEYERLFEVPRR